MKENIIIIITKWNVSLETESDDALIKLIHVITECCLKISLNIEIVIMLFMNNS